jgi:purine-binding chemotaxis protein CheW
MAAEASFCLFMSDSLPLGVPVAVVAEIVEVDALVRISLCPDRIVGLCPYHRLVVPVVTLGAGGARSEASPAECKTKGKAAHEAVLILQTEHGLWGVLIDREGTVITTERPAACEPRILHDGIVTVGTIHHGNADHAMLDAEATWRGLREGVTNWFERINESAPPARFLASSSGPETLPDPAVL